MEAPGLGQEQAANTHLYPIVQHHLETFLARAAEADPWGEGVPGWVEEDFIPGAGKASSAG